MHAFKKIFFFYFFHLLHAFGSGHMDQLGWNYESWDHIESNTIVVTELTFCRFMGTKLSNKPFYYN